MEMTAREIQRAIMRERWRVSTVMPNYTTANWWECDVFELTKAGYFREYEIKLSLSDFRADANKDQRTWDRSRAHDDRAGWSVRNKHHELATFDIRGPSKFWFVAPVGLIPWTDVPTWSGLIECHQSAGRVHTNEVRIAPRLHGTKAEATIQAKIYRTCYYRFQSLFIHKRLESDVEQGPKIVQ